MKEIFEARLFINCFGCLFDKLKFLRRPWRHSAVQDNFHTKGLKVDVPGFNQRCEAAKSGRFQVVFSPPLLADGSWRRLIDVAQHYDLGFELILLAHTFSLDQWAEALQDGAFDVLDVVCDLPKAAEAAKRAFWGSLPEMLSAACCPSECMLKSRPPKGRPNLEDQISKLFMGSPTGDTATDRPLSDFVTNAGFQAASAVD